MWTREEITAIDGNYNGDVSVVVASDGTRYICWQDATYAYRRYLYSSKPVGGSWSAPAVAVAGALHGEFTVAKYASIGSCRMDIDASDVVHFLYTSTVDGYIYEPYPTTKWYGVYEVYHRSGIGGSDTLLWSWTNDYHVTYLVPDIKAEALSVQNGGSYCIYRIWHEVTSGPPYVYRDAIWENTDIIKTVAAHPPGGYEIWCHNGTGGYARLIRYDSTTWETNLGITLPTGLYYATAIVTADGHIHVGGMLSYAPTYIEYVDGVDTTYTLSALDVWTQVWIGEEADGHIWCLWFDYDAISPFATNRTIDLDIVYSTPDYGSSNTYRFSGNGEMACVAGANAVAWGGGDLDDSHLIWVELKPGTFTSWHIM